MGELTGGTDGTPGGMDSAAAAPRPTAPQVTLYDLRITVERIDETLRVVFRESKAKGGQGRSS